MTSRNLMRNAVRGTAGFTLVEMLTVIAIIVLLAGMLLPAVAEAQRRIHAAASRAQIRSIETALDAYRLEWKDYPQSGLPATTPGTFPADDGAARLYRAVARPFRVGGTSGRDYGPYYNISDDERSTGLNAMWTSQAGMIGSVNLTGTPYIVDKIPPGMPILYYRGIPGRAAASEGLPYEHCLETMVRQPPPGNSVGRTLRNHYAAGTPAQGSPWALGASGGGKTNFFMLPPKLASTAETAEWRENPRWSVYAAGSTTNMMDPNNRLACEGRYMLVSPGLDRRYGTIDDIRNYESQ